MKFTRGHSPFLHAVTLIALPIVLSGCALITSPCREERFVAVAGSVNDGGLQVVSVTSYLHADRGARLTFYWQFSTPPLEGHITSVALVQSGRPVPILLQLPIREPIDPWGYAYAYEGTLEQRVWQTTPALGGIFEILAAGDGVLDLTTDLPAQLLVSIPLTVTEKADWHPSGCRS